MCSDWLLFIINPASVGADGRSGADRKFHWDWLIGWLRRRTGRSQGVFVRLGPGFDIVIIIAAMMASECLGAWSAGVNGSSSAG